MNFISIYKNHSLILINERKKKHICVIYEQNPESGLDEYLYRITPCWNTVAGILLHNVIPLLPLPLLPAATIFGHQRLLPHPTAPKAFLRIPRESPNLTEGRDGDQKCLICEKKDHG